MRLTPIAYNVIIIVMATIILGLSLWMLLYYLRNRRKKNDSAGKCSAAEAA
jgi:hypothetical protein